MPLHALATPADTRALLTKLDAMLQLQRERITRVSLAGRLNPEQARNLALVLQITDGLRELFQAETIRLRENDEG